MPAWGNQPQFKIEEGGGTTYTNNDGISIEVVRPENNISYAVITLTDYYNKNFVGVFDVFDTVDISFRQWATASWTKVFSGIVSNVQPTVSKQLGETLTVSAWGKGWALSRTHCNTSYGTESENPTIYMPQDILQDIITNHINADFDAVNTQWSIGDKTENVHAGFSVTNLSSPYLDNFTLINRLCDLTNAYAAAIPDISIHWYVDTSGNLYVKEIDASHTDGNWNKYWKSTQAASTITVTQDMVLYDFQKHIEEYANKIVLCTAFRKPAYDIWTEDSGPTWGVANATATYSAAQYIVGSHSLLIEPNAAPAIGLAYHPSTRDAGWDFTKCGSQNTIPRLNFYVRANDTNCFGFPVYLFTDSTACGGVADDYFWSQLAHYMTPRADKWVHVSLPIGPYYALDPSLQLDTGGDEFEWNITGSPSWSNINGIALLAGTVNAYDKFFDDLHFSGKIIRDAEDTSEITATKKEHQRVIRNDVALDDTLKATTDTGTAARLAYAELIRRAASPTVARIKVPLAVDMLPGHWIHVHACRLRDGTYRIDKDFRVKEVRHQLSLPEPGTILNVTDDTSNSHAFAAPDAFSLLQEYAGALGHAEAKNLKASGIDWTITRLSKAY